MNAFVSALLLSGGLATSRTAADANRSACAAARTAAQPLQVARQRAGVSSTHRQLQLHVGARQFCGSRSGALADACKQAAAAAAARAAGPIRTFDVQCRNDPWQDWPRQLQRFSETDLGRGLLLGTGLWLLLSGRLWWLFESVFVLIAMIVAGTFVGALVFRQWLQKQRVINSCPVCGNTVELAPASSLLTQCPQCRSILRFDPEILSFVVEESTRSATPGDPFGGPFGGNYQQQYDPKSVIIEVDAEEIDEK